MNMTIGKVRSIEECCTFERTNELVRYDPITGLFYDRKTGDEIGWMEHCYIRLYIDDKKYYAHRVAHLLMNGEWPEGNPSTSMVFLSIIAGITFGNRQTINLITWEIKAPVRITLQD